MIDRLYKEIQDRLEQVLAEADRLRKALAALDPRSGSSGARRTARRPAAAGARQTRSPGKAPRAAAPRPGAGRTGPSRGGSGAPRAAAPRRAAGSGGTGRTAPGATRTAVLDALKGGSARTAGEISAETGITRGTVSTTLTKLSKSGDVVKASRGYTLPGASGGSGATGATGATGAPGGAGSPSSS